MSALRGTFINEEAAPLAVGDIVRPGTVAGKILAAKANTLAGSVPNGVLLTAPASGAVGGIQTSGVALVNFTGSAPAVGDVLYLSNTDAGKCQAALPVSAFVATIGRALGNNGTQVLVALDLDTWPTQTKTPYLKDEFEGGSHSSAGIGELGWGFTNGTWVRIGAPADHPGIMRRTSSAVSGQFSSHYLTAFTGATTIRQDQWSSWTWIVSPQQSGANSHDVRLGVANGWTAAPTDGVYFERLTTEANWFVVTRAGGVQTRTDTTIAYTAATYYSLHARKNAAGSIEFYVDGVLRATHAANIPGAATALIEGGHIVPNTAAARDVDVDFFDEQFLVMAR